MYVVYNERYTVGSVIQQRVTLYHGAVIGKYSRARSAMKLPLSFRLFWLTSGREENVALALDECIALLSPVEIQS